MNDLKFTTAGDYMKDVAVVVPVLLIQMVSAGAAKNGML